MTETSGALASNWAAQVAHMLKWERKLYLKESKAGNPTCKACRTQPTTVSHNDANLQPVFTDFCINCGEQITNADRKAANRGWILFEMRRNHIPVRRVSLDREELVEEEVTL